MLKGWEPLLQYNASGSGQFIQIHEWHFAFMIRTYHKLIKSLILTYSGLMFRPYDQPFHNEVMSLVLTSQALCGV